MIASPDNISYLIIFFFLLRNLKTLNDFEDLASLLNADVTKQLTENKATDKQ